MRVWATGRSEAKRAVATALGADAVFEAEARLPERVDAVFETVGGATWSHSVKALKPGGIVVISGTTTGDASPAELQRIFFLQLRVVGSTMGTLDELRDLLSFCAQQSIQPQIGIELPMEEAERGFRAMVDGETSGKIVFTR
jgi:D-arabinose 1-dehydrogenase-like Zn-dependent alcohol dehydrogenase